MIWRTSGVFSFLSTFGCWARNEITPVFLMGGMRVLDEGLYGKDGDFVSWSRRSVSRDGA